MAKGDQWERDIARELSVWWTSDKDEDDVFWRVRGSGGRATTRKKKGKKTANQEADIMATDERGLPLTNTCSIELKKGYNDTDLMSCIDKAKGNNEPRIGKFITQVCSSSLKDGESVILEKHPILIIRRDYKKPVIGVHKELYDWFEKQFVLSHATYPSFDKITISIEISLGMRIEMLFMRYTQFLEWCDPIWIKQLDKKRSKQKCQRTKTERTFHRRK